MEKDKNEYFYKIMASWRSIQFDFILQYIRLTETELKKYNVKNFVNEMEID